MSGFGLFDVKKEYQTAKAICDAVSAFAADANGLVVEHADRRGVELPNVHHNNAVAQEHIASRR